jgi:TP901-1 family phage major tail protein
MTAQKGKDLLLKVASDGAGSFATVAGLRARTLAFNAAAVDITDQESAGHWRELLEGAGIKTARVAGSCIFKDAPPTPRSANISSAARCAPGG